MADGREVILNKPHHSSSGRSAFTRIIKQVYSG